MRRAHLALMHLHRFLSLVVHRVHPLIVLLRVSDPAHIDLEEHQMNGNFFL